MGSGSFSSARYMATADLKDYDSAPIGEIFTQRDINNAMSPYGVKLRESRDSEEHPNSLAVIIGLDVTGSMGSVPHHLVKKGLPDIMDNIIQKGEKDPQVLFLGIGDHECDRAPLQVSQFESSDELLDKWLTSVYLEGGGGPVGGESYLLAWYFAGLYTEIDCFEKRKRKGFLFTIGDEPNLNSLSASTQKTLMGDGQYKDLTANELFDKASEKYNVFHIHLTETGAGSNRSTQDKWSQNLGKNLLIAQSKEDIPNIISNTIISFGDVKSEQNISSEEKSNTSVEGEEGII